MAKVEIIGTGSYLPGEPISNEQLAAVFGREVIWLAEMLGAQTRHFGIDLNNLELRPGESNANMATKAAYQALSNANIDPHSLDLIVMATSTPDYPFPATALFVQEQLGIPACSVIELRSGCGGMAQAFMIATHLLAAGTARKALLIGSDLISPFVSLFRMNEPAREFNKEFLVSLAMFGDGAGALVLSGDSDREGVLDCLSMSISTGRPAAMLLKSGGALAPVGFRKAEDWQVPNKVFNHDFHAILEHGPELIQLARDWLLQQKGYDLSAVDYFIPPQVNGRLIDLTAQHVGISQSKVISDFARVGNTVSASIYIALDHLNRQKLLKSGDLLVLLPAEATKWLYGAVVVRWTMKA